jgi:phosphoglucosamine mutase
MNKLFGTDGIRGRANQYPMTVDIAQALGISVSKILTTKKNVRHQVVIGKDTRTSGNMFEAALASGLCAGGFDAIHIGILPTPAVAFVTQLLNADAGFMISASHNPSEDNGIKIFSSNGYKLSYQLESEIESYVLAKSWKDDTLGDYGNIFYFADAPQQYINFVKQSVTGSWNKQLSLVVDCANGAASTVARPIFESLSNSVTMIHEYAEGKSINKNCGAMDTRSLQDTVLKTKADIGIAFDGDADRLVLCDSLGNILNGDHVLAICGRYLLQNNNLPQKTIVATQYSNMGLDDSIRQCGGNVIRVLNGDRYVIEKMRDKNLILGGEASGHLIFQNYSTTGDGLIAALQVLNVMNHTGKTLAQLKECITLYPQVIKNVSVREKKELETMPSVIKLINTVNDDLGTNGRTLIRYSGTENKIRIMIEGKDPQQITNYADQIAQEIQTQIGV